MLRPINDFCLIELASDKYGFQDTKDKAETGILVELPDKFNYFGFYSFAFEASLDNHKALQALYDYYKSKVGQRVYWLALSEKGAILKQGDKTFALIKLTSLMAADEDVDDIATNVLDTHGGSFSA